MHAMLYNGTCVLGYSAVAMGGQSTSVKLMSGLSSTKFVKEREEVT